MANKSSRPDGFPASYTSDRDLGQLVTGDDDAAPLIQATAAGNAEQLRHLLADPEHAKTALQSPIRIYRKRANDVMAMGTPNFMYLLQIATKNGHAAAVNEITVFANRNPQIPAKTRQLTREIISNALASNEPSLLDALAAYEPKFYRRLLLHGKTPFSEAVTKGKRRSLEWLFSKGIATPEFGELHRCVSSRNIRCMQVLKDHGADLNARFSRTAILERRVAVSDEDFCSWTPSHVAAWDLSVDALEWLENQGADTSIEDNHGRTPRQLMACKHERFAQLRAEREARLQKEAWQG